VIFTRRNFIDVFFTKLKYNLKSEASKTYLGYVWWVLEPALYVAVLYLVFGTFRARGSPEFVVFLVCGQIPYLWFSKSVMNSTGSIMAGRGLINQVPITKAFFPLLVVAQDVVKQFFVFILMFAFLVWYGLDAQATWLLVPAIALTQLLLIIACSLVVASITPFIPDFRFIVATAMILMMFMSGIFYDYREVILPRHHELFLANPMANLLEHYRRVLMHGQQPDWWALCRIAGGSALVTWLMLQFYRKMDTAYARLVIR
jgi:lipopolysaccharide transport system permease protein